MTRKKHPGNPRHSRRVAIAGASGLVGRHILERLLADDTVSEVHAVCRRSLGTQDPKLIEHLVDFSNLPPLAPVDELYLALGTTIRDAGSQAAFHAVDFEANLAVAKIACAAGARRIALVSAAGADPRAHSFYLRVKGELEAAITSLDTDAILIVRPSLLLGNRAALGQPKRRVESIAMSIFGRLDWLLPKVLRPVAAQSVADALTTRLPALQGLVIVASGEIHGLRAVSSSYGTLIA